MSPTEEQTEAVGELEEDKISIAPKRDIVRTSVAIELKELMARSAQLQVQIKTAKTATKAKYYHKKLQRNNREAMQMLIALESMKR